MMVSGKTFHGEIRFFPKEIVEMMVRRAIEQGGSESVDEALVAFAVNRWSGKEHGGFDWRETEEGHAFWSEVIGERNFVLFDEVYGSDLRFAVDWI